MVEQHYSRHQTLKHLDSWLCENLGSSAQSRSLVARLHEIWRRQAVELLGPEALLGVTARRFQDQRVGVWLHLLSPLPIQLANQQQLRKLDRLTHAISVGVVEPFWPRPAVHLEFISPDKVGGTSPSTFADQLQELASAEGSVFLGLVGASHQRDFVTSKAD